LGDDAAERLEFDQTVAQRGNRRMLVWRDVANAEIGSSEETHAAGVQPVAGGEQGDVRAKQRHFGFDEQRAPVVGWPPEDALRRADDAAAGVERRRDDAEDVAQVLERRRIRDRAADNDAVLGCFNLPREAGVRRANDRLLEVLLEDGWLRVA